MADLTEQLYIIKRIDTGYLKAASGTYATPKLYKRGDAVRVCKGLNRRVESSNARLNMNNSMYEVIPVHLQFGDPIYLE